MRWIVITGANGFIGHNLLAEFLDQRPQTLDLGVEHILGADLEHSLDRATHAKVIDCATYEFCLAQDLELRIQELTHKWGQAPLAILHNGACSSTTETDPEVFRTLNVESSQNLFRLCTRLQIPFLYASSASVYGDGLKGFSDALEDNDQFHPLNLYGQSKHRFDSWVLEQSERPPVWFGLRYFNVFGPNEEHKKSQASVLHWGRRQIEEQGRLLLYKSHREDIANGEQRRDFVSSFDVVRVTIALLKLALSNPTLVENGAFVNIGRGEATSWLEVGTALFAALEKTAKFEFVDMPASLRDHYQNYTQAKLDTLHKLGITESFLSHEQAFKLSLEV